MAYEKSGNCWNCGTALSASDYGRGDSCPKCGRDTKTCKGCEFYDRGSNNECRENQADRVVDKERANFCDYFRPRAGLSGTGGPSKDSALSAAEALFKKR
ncbi:MAG: hypothetical protein P4M08_08145 [Oligoflexia bacterium]|nr:hypothetical protein [Oligoflexia bacterium]